MSSLSSMSAIHFDYVVDEYVRRYNVIGRNYTRRYDLSRLDDYRCGGCGHDRIEVTCCQRVVEVTSLAMICRCVSGLVPICDTITLRTAFAAMRSPMPTPGRAVSLAITVKLLRPCRTSSAMIRCGLPTPKNPPIMTEAPSGIFSIASDKAIVLCICLVRLFAVGKRRRHVRNEQHDQNAKCDVIGNCHSGASRFG